MENAVKKDFQFVRGNLMFTPYVPGAGVFREDALIGLYQRLHDEGLWNTVFHENTSMTLLEFMNFFSGGQNLLQILSLVDGDRVVDAVGMCWLSDITSCQGILNRAVGSFVFFKEYQKPMYTDQFCDMAMEWWFEVLGLDVLMGVTPESNRAALVYVKRIGMREVCRVPEYTTYDGHPETAVVTIMRKADYRMRATGG